MLLLHTAATDTVRAKLLAHVPKHDIVCKLLRHALDSLAGMPSRSLSSPVPAGADAPVRGLRPLSVVAARLLSPVHRLSEARRCVSELCAAMHPDWLAERGIGTMNAMERDGAWERDGSWRALLRVYRWVWLDHACTRPALTPNATVQ